MITTDTTLAFQKAIREGRWDDAADMVAEHTHTRTTSEGGCYALADWMAEGRWDGSETPESVAAEWDAID